MAVKHNIQAVLVELNKLAIDVEPVAETFGFVVN